MRQVLFAIFLIVPLSACSFGSMFGTPDERVPGYDELKASYCNSESESYDEAACQRFALDEALADYREAQAVIISIMGNPDVPDAAKTTLREADKAAVDAYRAYTEAVLQSSGETEALLLASLTALQSVQTKLNEILAEQEGG